MERALINNHTESMLTVDVKGNFKYLLPGRLIRCLREQGWPEKLVKWVASFTTNRGVDIRLDGEVGPSQIIVCGLAQESPISPILFILYIFPLLKTRRISRNFEHVDSVSLLESSNFIDENCVSFSRIVIE